MSTLKKLLLGVLLLFLAGSLAWVQDQEKPEETPPPKKEEKLAAYIRFQRQGKVWKESGYEFASFDQVELYQSERVIKADSFIGWKKEKRSDEKTNGKKLIYDEIYAQGNVTITSGKDEIVADQVYFNFKDHTGIIINAKITSVHMDEKDETRPESVPVIIRAKTVYQINQTTLLAKNTSVTTCPQGKPHYKLYAKKVWFISDEKNKRVVMYHIIPMIEGIPFFYWPYYRKVIGNDPFIRSIQYKKTDRFGHTVTVRYGFNLNKHKLDQNGQPVKDKYGHEVTRRWGDLKMKTTYFQKRGTGSQANLVYKWKRYRGFIKGAYIRDKGPDPDISYDQQFLPLEKSKRARVKSFHRHDLGEKFRLDTEVSWLSDRNLLLEFFEKEAKEGKEQETYTYLRYRHANTGGTLLERVRANNFQTQTEYLPQATFQVLNEPFHLLGPNHPFYISSFFQTDNIRKKYDDDLNLDAPHIWRFDSLAELTWPRQLGFIKTVPFLASRWSAYGENILEDKKTYRTVATGGLRLFSQFYRIFNTQNKSLGINKLYHTVSFDLRYATNFRNSTPATELIQFDSLDEIDRFAEIYFEIRNRFKTQSGDSFWQFLDIGAAIEYYPRSERDTVSENHNNYLGAMNWISLSPDKNWDFTERRISNVNLDLVFTPHHPFSIGLNSEYNTYDKRSEIFNGYISLQPYTGWHLTISERYIVDKTNALGLNISCTPMEKWQLISVEQYDFLENRLISRSYALRRDLHDMFLEFSVSVDKGKDETMYYITLTPKGIWERPFSMRSY